MAESKRCDSKMMTSEATLIKLCWNGLGSVSAFNKYESTHLKALLTPENQSLFITVCTNEISFQAEEKKVGRYQDILKSE